MVNIKRIFNERDSGGKKKKTIVAILCHEMIPGNFVNIITAQRIVLNVLRDGSSSRERRAWRRVIIRCVARETRSLAIAIEFRLALALTWRNLCRFFSPGARERNPGEETHGRRDDAIRIIDAYKSRNYPRRCCGVSTLINAFPRLYNLRALRAAKFVRRKPDITELLFYIHLLCWCVART